jgi:hypothetical protein
MGGVQVLTFGLIAQHIGAQELPAFLPGRWGGLLEFGYVRESQATHSAVPASDIGSKRRLVTEQLTLWNEGFAIYDPRLFTGKLAVTLGIAQDRDSTDGHVDASNNHLNGYAFDGFVLAEMPLSGRLFANRTRHLLTQTFSRTDSTFQNFGGELRLVEDNPLRKWGIRNLSSNLTAEQQHLRETTTSVLGQTYQRDERQRILTWAGHNGFLQSDLDWRLEHDDYQDYVLDRGSFRTDSGLLTYSVDLGPDRNWRSDSQLSFSNRSGAVPLHLLTADERLHIEHYTNLSTDYRYQWQRLEVQSSRTATQTESAQLQHQLYRNLTTTAALSAAQVDLDAGRRNTYAGRLNLGYRRNLPGSGIVTVNFAGREQLDDNRLLAAQIRVTDEPHGAPAQLGAGAGFDLTQPLVAADSIVVVDTRGGARLDTVLGVDYEVVQRADRTTILPLVTSAVIQPSDPLVISYVYTVDPSSKYRTAARALSAGLDYGWIALSAGHEQLDQTLLSGQDARFLDSSRKKTAQVDLRGHWSSWQADAGAAYLAYAATRQAYTQWRYRGSATYRATRGLSLVLGADRTLTDFTLPVERTDLQSLRLTLTGITQSGWNLSGLASRRVYKDSLQPTETVDELGLKARFDYAKLSLQSGLTFNQRSRGGFRSDTWRADLTLVRRL